MITALLSLILVAQAPSNGADSPTTPSTSDTAAGATRLAADIAIKSAESELASMTSRSPLLERVLQQARQAFDDGRYDEAIGYARRARVTAGRRGREAAKTTAPAAPVTALLYEAMERLLAAENLRMSDPKVITARELVSAAEAAIAEENITQADQLAKRAIMILSTLGIAPPATTRAESGLQPVSLNEAPLKELMTIPGVTSEMARNILWFRKHIGPFRALDDLRFVPGFSTRFVVAARPLMKL